SKRYFKLLSNTFFWEVEDHGTLSRVRLDREAHRWGMELSTEASLSATVVVLQAMSEQNIMPTQVTFKHSAPEDLTDHNKAFQSPNCSMGILFDSFQNREKIRKEKQVTVS
ncbi:MAG: AraC family transcriptional regulator ligand-binding domain-containing protein, partial [Bacteroidota bacterium]